MSNRPAAEHLGNLQDPAHFARLVESDPGWRTTLDRLADLTRRVLDVPFAQVNVVLGEEQHSLSSVAGDGEFRSWNGPRSVAVEASYCQHVIGSGEPLVVENALDHPLVRENRATREAGLGSYVGLPLKNQAGRTMATLCVADFQAREWDSRGIEALTALADLLMRELRTRLVAEEQLQQGEARFQSLLENGADLITVLDPEGRIGYRSPAWARILGYEGSELDGIAFSSLVHPSEVKAWERSFFTALARPEGRATGEWRVRHRDGSWHTIRGRGVNLLHDPAVRGLVLNMYDVTRRRQLEAELHQAQKMEAVGRLAGGVAHDFNNFLTAIQSNADFLLDRNDLPAGAETDVQEIQQVARQATRVTRQLLTFSRADVVDFQVFDVSALLEETVPLVKRLAGVDMEIRTHFQDDVFVKADQGQLSQVIMNLAVNARDAMPEGGTLDLRSRVFTATEEYTLSHSEMQPGEYAMLVVSDNGEGMARDVQRRIFDPFFSTKKPGQGTGLGLSICWGIVKQMDGHIHLYSEPGLGTTFRIYLPLVSREVAAQALTLPGQGNGAPPDRGDQVPDTPERVSSLPATILVVEDQPEIRRVMRRALEAEGYLLLEATSGEEAVELAREHDAPLQLLLTDVLLPGMNGHELAERLSRNGDSLAVLFTSGFTRTELSDQRVEIAPDAFLPKPFGPRALTDAVAEALSR